MRTIMKLDLRRLGPALALPALLAALPATASAAVPASLTEQGRLFDGAGAPLTGTVSIQFAVYAAASGGAPLWTETQTVSLDAGYFSATLGGTTPFPAGLWDGSVRYVGITVGSDAEMSPRHPATSVPYALVAGDATGDLHPRTVTVNGTLVIDAAGNWVGPATGLVGPTGAQGVAGASGAPGVAGATGAQGVAGATGPQGPAGATGSAGATGAAGAVGPTGPLGPQGVVGPTGAAGTAGAVGATGPQGAAGTNGSNGAAGATGPQGPAGTNGAAGPAGPQGPAGTNGTNGTNGSVGPTGPQGPAGATGAAGVITTSTTAPVNCDAAHAGYLYFNSTSSAFIGCNGTTWATFTATSQVGVGDSQSNAGATCKTIHAAYPVAASGTFWIDPDGGSTANAFQVYCDMTTDSGGWAKILQYTGGAYTPSVGAVPDPTGAAITAFAKLSDVQINAIGGTGALKNYRFQGDKTSLALYLKTTNTYVDTGRSMNLTTGTIQACEAGSLATCSFTAITSPTIDTVAWGIAGNDCNRIFTDYTTTPMCYTPADSTKRCFTAGQSCGSHAQIGSFTIWIRE
jgi:hypothetical protein